MTYCYQCGHITPGEPLFCNHCGRSYDVKLCPRLHRNPRSAEACSQCGSRDLSTPQPRVPLWVPILQFLLLLVPGLILAVVSAVVLGLFLIELVRSRNMLAGAFLLSIALASLWWVWAQLPTWFRRLIHHMLKRRREDPNGGRRR